MILRNYKIYPYCRAGKYTFHVVFYDMEGKKVSRSTGITYETGAGRNKIRNLQHAAEKEAILIVERYALNKHKEFDRNNGGLKLSTFLEKHYLPSLKTNRRPGTYVRVSNDLKKFLRIIGDKQLRMYKPLDAEVFKENRLGAGLTKTSVDIELRSVKTVFMTAEKWDLLHKSPYRGEAVLFKEKSARRSFTEAELSKLFEVSKGTIGGMIFRLAYYTGMRKGELSSLTWGMFDEGNKAFLLPASNTKSGKSRYVPLNKHALAIVYEFREMFEEKVKRHSHYYSTKPKDDCYVLQKQRGWGKYECRSIGDVFRKARAKAGLSEQLKFHCLRHSTATHAIARGVELSKITKLLGHSTVAVTEQFYDHTTALAHREAVDILSMT